MEMDFKQIALNLSKNKYRFIGEGSGRVVFNLENGYVIKVAKNKKGIAQNKAEFEISRNENSILIAKILEVSESFRYLIMQKAESINYISFVWNYFKVRNNKELYLVKDLVELSQKHNLLIRDLGRVVNWGKIDGRPVIVDYGFTQSVRSKYY